MPDYDAIIQAVENNEPIPENVIQTTKPSNGSYITESDHSYKIYSLDEKKDHF